MSRASAAPASPQEGDSQDYSEDAYTDELIEQILENYTFKFEPEVRLKLKHRLPEYTLCACYSKPWSAQNRWRFTVKPSKEDSPVSRYVRSALVVPELGQVALFSSKINISVFRLQFVLGYNWKQRLPSLDYRGTCLLGTKGWGIVKLLYRLTTKWGDGPRLKRKERVQVSEAFNLRAKWNLEAHFPDLEGHLGAGGNRGTAVDVDYGGVSFEVTQLDGVLEV